uniref:Scarecrow-like protein 28 n=1 Tax=Anthurium amnicola TaxID=1678845 RepID=A0A1D1XIS6_9ARAE
MLAGCCSSTLLSPRHRLRSEASSSVPFQACHLQVQEKLYPSQQKMSTQRLDLPCSLSRKEAPRVTLSLEKAIETRSSCSFRPNPVTLSSSSSSLVAQTAPWETRREIEAGYWEKKATTLKRFHERSSTDDPCEQRAKRKKIYRGGQLAGAGAGVWFPSSGVEYLPLDEEQRAFSLPSGVEYLPPLPASSEPLVSSFGSDVADKGDNDAGTSEGSKQKAKPDSSPASETHSSSPDANVNTSEFETGNGSHHPNPSGATGVAGEGGGDTQRRRVQEGLDLVNQLTACVESIGSRNHEATTFFLARLGDLASPAGPPIHRVAAYFTEALVLRVVRLWPHVFSIAPRRELLDRMEDDDDAMALRLLNHVSPIPKFIHFTLNERLLRAFHGKDRVHIIDFDIKQGLQWPSLFQSLASRPNPPSHVRITGIGESKQELQETGARLAAFAEALNLPFEFHVVVDRLEDVRLWMLHVKEGECVAVNCVLQLHKMLRDDGGAALTDFLGLIRSTNPDIVLVAEQEAGNNEPRWEARFAASLPYYAAVFDVMDSSLPLGSPARVKVEEMFGREIRNIVSCEGSERVERHELFGRWRRMMEERGYRCAGIGEREMLQSQMLLRMFPCNNYSLQRQGDGDAAGLTLRWLDQPLYTVSTWAPIDISGSSSSKSQPD